MELGMIGLGRMRMNMARWNQGSVVRSWLLELLEPAFAKDPNLTSIQRVVDDSGEGRWNV